MLRVTPMSAARAKRYFTWADYYTQDQELPGVWRGQGAARLGLAGVVEKAPFEALCDNRRPYTGGRVTARTRDDRTAGYDFNFHAPKSVSLLNALTDGDEVLRAFQAAVDEAMRLIEADMKARVRKGKVYEDRPTGEMAWARFDHLTARPVGGVPDPHLHSHCFVQNMTFDAEEGLWKAGQFRDLKRDAPFYQAVFHANLAARLRDLGYGIETRRDGWEVAGLSRATLEKFSRRTAQIEAVAAERGIVSPEEKAELGAKTRQGKAKGLAMRELQRLWVSRLDADEQEALHRVRARAEPVAEVGLDAREALDFACRHLFERNSVVAERKLLATTLQAAPGRVSLDEATAALRESSVLVREVRGQRLATTREVLAEEEKMIAFARDGRGRCDPLGPTEYTPDRTWLTAGQRAAVRHVLTAPDRVMLIRGGAGTGKTALMQEAVAAIERGGKKVFAFAPSANASRGVLRQEGFHTADTVARYLVDARLQEETRGQVLWIDEAGLLGAKAVGQLFALAERLDCRVILAGDRKQHGSVERGAVLRVLERQAGLVAAEVKDIQRQKGEYKEAVAAIADGRAGEGFDRLDALGWVKEIADEARDRQLAADYVATVQGGQTALVVSPTHAEGAAVTAAIRQALREQGRIGGEDRSVATLARLELTEAERGEAASYLPGDVLQFHQNAKGFRLGDRLTVEEGRPPPLDQARRFQVYRAGSLALAAGDRVRITKGGKTKDGHKLENGSVFALAGFTPEGDLRLQNGWVVDRAFGHLAYGYVSTSHAAQGQTVDHVLVGQSSQSLPATSREQFYVSASRGRKQVTMYTDDKAALREAVQESDDRLAATELLRDAAADATRVRLRLARSRGEDRPATPIDDRQRRVEREVVRE